jgi:hypothetical protein
MDSCQVVRDTSLDLDNEKSELLRPEMLYPSTLVERNRDRESLLTRKETPDGFVIARYKCTDWYRTNGLVIPAASELTIGNYTGSGTRYRGHIFKLTATAISLTNIGHELLPNPILPTYVNDYRYRRSGNSRIFRRAEYTLRPGDSWKSGNDPALLGQAEEWLKNGRRYDDYGISWRNILVWSILAALVVLPGAAILWPKKLNQTD